MRDGDNNWYYLINLEKFIVGVFKRVFCCNSQILRRQRWTLVCPTTPTKMGCRA
jgi:hypothetical protein